MTEKEPLRRVNILIQGREADAVAIARGMTVSALIRALIADAYWEDCRLGRIATAGDE